MSEMSEGVFEGNLRAHLLAEEGLRERVYLDSLEFPTVGIGHLLSKAECEKYQVGDQWPLLRIYAVHETEIAQIKQDFRLLFSPDGINIPRRIALLSMIFQLGRGGVAGFRRMCAAVDARNWSEAATEALDSRWAKEQTPERAGRIAETLRSGRLCWPQ